jgi:hypothetical protein
MAVILEIDASLQELMSKLGLDAGLISDATANGLEVKYTLKGVTIFQNAIHASADAPIKMGVLQSILNGKLPGGAAKILLASQLQKAVKLVLAECGVATKGPPFLAGQEKQVFSGSVPDKAKATTSAQLEAIFGGKKGASGTPKAQEPKNVAAPIPGVEATAKIGVSPLTQAFKAAADILDAVGPKCKLLDATKLFQPVQGSDPNSTYFVVALSQSLKIAARMKTNQKISIRVEGEHLDLFQGQLELMGLSGSTDSHYSVHLSCDSSDLARKSVGAIICGIGCDFDAVATNLHKIWGKGA